jgi:hypothetical protein
MSNSAEQETEDTGSYVNVAELDMGCTSEDEDLEVKSILVEVKSSSI